MSDDLGGGGGAKRTELRDTPCGSGGKREKATVRTILRFLQLKGLRKQN